MRGRKSHANACGLCKPWKRWQGNSKNLGWFGHRRHAEWVAAEKADRKYDADTRSIR